MSTVKVEPRTHTAELEWCAQERLAQAPTVGREVVRRAARGRPADRAIGLTPVDELHCQELSVADRNAILAQGLVGEIEAVTRADIEHKVDVPTEDLGDLEGRCIADPGAVSRLEQRTFDHRARRAQAALERVYAYLAAQAAIRRTRRSQRLSGAQPAFERQQPSIVDAQPQFVSGDDAVDASPQLWVCAQCRKFSRRQTLVTEDALQSVAEDDGTGRFADRRCGRRDRWSRRRRCWGEGRRDGR